MINEIVGKRYKSCEICGGTMLHIPGDISQCTRCGSVQEGNSMNIVNIVCDWKYIRREYKYGTCESCKNKGKENGWECYCNKKKKNMLLENTCKDYKVKRKYISEGSVASENICIG